MESYRPREIEETDYGWEPTRPQGSQERFTICLPPPNVTGSLHLGHALTCSIQDAIVRFKRMTGHATLWIPGTDHAGISTQAVVERQIQRELGQTRHQLGRERFLEEVWKWKGTYQRRITEQLKRLGCLLDWDREFFTMDESLSRATREAFLRLYRDGLIYRADRLVNWDATLKTTVSDIEVEKIAVERATPYRYPGYSGSVELGVMDYFYYPLESGERIMIATTRLETMLGDQAVAVHPDHPVYGQYIGQRVVHPFNGERLPIIADEMADPDFGTGAVKITPAHDQRDYLCGLRHQLPVVSIFNEDGTVNDRGVQFRGLHRFDARKAIVKALKERDLYHRRVDHAMSVPVSSRSGDVIELLPKPQWYLSCKTMAQRALAAVRSGDIKITPQHEEHEYSRWLENIQDWCISRQLWWGHPVPLYRQTDDRGRESWSTEPIGEPDGDVLDTWFSSALIPLSCQGWPERVPEPLDLLETGRDILFFWVTRMIMMSLQLADQIPFREVLLHGMVRDEQGRKMSKSLGNVIDPLDVIDSVTQATLLEKIAASNLSQKEKEVASKNTRKSFPRGIPECGTDGLRFTLFRSLNGSSDIHLNINEVVKGRHFCNKLLNLTRFYLSKRESLAIPDTAASPISQTFLERWITSEMVLTRTFCRQAFESYSFSDAVKALHQFLYLDLCDVYLEAIKPRLLTDSEESRRLFETLERCLLEGLKMLHPFMPFITQYLFNLIRREPKSLLLEEYPENGPSDHPDPGIKEAMNGLLETVHAVLSLKASHRLTRRDRPVIAINQEYSEEQRALIDQLGFCETVVDLEQGARIALKGHP
jgi:valyl-tRNA synthetase